MNKLVLSLVAAFVLATPAAFGEVVIGVWSSNEIPAAYAHERGPSALRFEARVCKIKGELSNGQRCIVGELVENENGELVVENIHFGNTAEGRELLSELLETPVEETD